MTCKAVGVTAWALRVIPGVRVNPLVTISYKRLERGGDSDVLVTISYKPIRQVCSDEVGRAWA